MKKYARIVGLLICLAGCVTYSGAANTIIQYSEKEGSLQQVIDAAPSGSTVACDSKKQHELNVPLTIKKAITLKGLNARLPKKLGKTSLIVVNAAGVTLTDLELHGNYDSVDQNNRAPLIQIHKGGFRVERCQFYDSSKDGVEVSPESGGEDIVGGVIKDIKAFRIGRDAVSLSGGNEGLKVRNVTVENVHLKKGYLRGAVEISDGTDNITVRGVYAENCPYAIDVQDHRGKSAANTHIQIEDVTAVNCRHIIRSANSPRGHTGLTLRNFTAKNCEEPVKIAHTKDVSIDGLKILNHQSKKHSPISFKNCQHINIKNVVVESAHFYDQPVMTTNCKNVHGDKSIHSKPSTPH